MPVEVSYPGVYIEELSSATQGIAPVATGITAFVGRTLWGPVERASDIFNFGDLQRLFGGLAVDYPLSYAVQQFFENGGSQAQICRLFEHGVQGDGYARLSLATAEARLGLVAANPGAWGNRLSASVDTDGITAQTMAPFTQYGLGESDLFNLTLSLTDAEGRIVASERYLNLAVADRAGTAPFPNRIDRVLENQSNLARVDMLPEAAPITQSVVSDGNGDNGTALSPTTMIGNRQARTGLYSLDNSDLFNLLCLPPDRRIHAGGDVSGQDLDPAVRQAAASYCAERRAIFIVDPPADWQAKVAAGQIAAIDPASLGISGTSASGSPIARNAAVYFPRIIAEDMLDKGRPAVFAPCGAVAGIIAATDMARGIWKAPAGQSAGIAGIVGLETDLDDAANGVLNPLGINCLRNFSTYGPVVWGARTLQGADALADDYKYLPVRRLVLFIEETVSRGTRWTAFEANNEALWSSLRLQISSFLADLQRQGAFYSYTITCDATTTTQVDIDQGVVNILVLIAPAKPAEFIVIQIQQSTQMPAAE